MGKKSCLYTVENSVWNFNATPVQEVVHKKYLYVESLKNWWCLKSLNMGTFLIIKILLPNYLKSSNILKYYSLPSPHTYTRACAQITLTVLINYSYSISQFSIAQYFIIKNGLLILNLIWSTGFLKFPFVSFLMYFWFLSMKGSSFSGWGTQLWMR